MEARELWRDGKSIKELCARFGLSKSAMRYAVSGRSWKHLPLLLLILLMATPAFGQGRFIITDGSTQSEYGSPSPDRNVICPVCSDAGKKSTVRRWLGYSSTLNFSPSLYERTEARFWDEDGRYHDHELAQELLVCSAGHRFYDFDDRRCWCEWPGKRYVVLDEVKGETITLPEGRGERLLDHSNGITYTPNGAVIMPMSYQHPFIQPDLTSTVKTAPRDYGANHRFDRSFWLASGLFAAALTADIITTHKALERGAVELNPFFADQNGAGLRTSANVIATTGIWAIAAYCEKRGHRRFGRILLLTGAAIRTAAAFWNHNRRR
jgi:hypothetical protein